VSSYNTQISTLIASLTEYTAQLQAEYAQIQATVAGYKAIRNYLPIILAPAATAPAGLRIRARALVRAKAEHGSHELAKLVPVFLSLGEIFAAMRAKRMSN
jgi:hypothetical protein